MLINIILSSLAIMLASLIGAISVWKKLGTTIEKNLHYLVSFSAGVFLFIAYELGHEAEWSAWIVLGVASSLLLFKIIPDFHHHHDGDASDHGHSRLDARRIIVSDAIHNIGDGILLAASFSVSIALGLATSLSVFIHEIIQEISEFFVLKQAGFDTKKALILNFLTSATILIGAIGGYFLLEKFEAIEHPLLGITAGAFFVIVVHDLIPHSIQSIKTKKHVSQHVLWFVFGAILISIASAIIPHMH